MTDAAQQAQALHAQINSILNNNHPDSAVDPISAWADLCALEDERAACQKIADEEAREEASNNGQFGLGA